MNLTSREFDFRHVFHSMPGMRFLVMPDRPDYTIIDVSDDLLYATNNTRNNLVKKKLFDTFPISPDDPKGIAIKKLRKSLDKVVATKKPHKMKVQRNDVRNNEGLFYENYWTPVNIPVLNRDGEISYIIHSSENVTEKVLSEKKAKVTNDNFEYFLNQAFAPFAILSGKDLTFTFANAAYQQLMNGRQLVGKTLEQAIPEIKGQPFMSLLQKVFDTGIPFHAPAIEATANFTGSSVATTKYFNLSYTPYKNNEGITEGVLASGYDITDEIELKKKEERKVLNQQSYNLFMQAPVGFSLVRGENHIVEMANAAGLRLAGKDKEAIGKPLAELLQGKRGEEYIELLNKVKKEGKTLKVKETPITFTRNGKEEIIFVNLTFQPYYEDNKIEGVLNVSTDVTEQVLARRKVEAAELKARLAIESAQLGVYEINLFSNEVNGDKRFFELFGFEQPVEWRALRNVIAKEDVPVRDKAYEEAMITGRLFYETKIILKDNSVRWLKISGRAFFNEQKVPERLLGIVEDITRHKSLEQQKDTFLSIASHELKTPVTTIKAYGQLAETLLERSGETQALTMIRKMGTQVDRLTNLIEDLLDVRKIQAGKLMFTDTDFDIGQLVSEVADDMQKTSATHAIVCNTVDGVAMYGDKDKVSQVLTNFISNAIKYSPKADKIIVNAAKKDNDILLSVQDFGIGISEKNIDNVFEQFYRVKGDNQSTFPGMGIGLYICSEIVKRQGGKIWAESEIGKGSTFYVQLPLDYRHADKH